MDRDPVFRGLGVALAVGKPVPRCRLSSEVERRPAGVDGRPPAEVLIPAPGAQRGDDLNVLPQLVRLFELHRFGFRCRLHICICLQRKPGHRIHVRCIIVPDPPRLKVQVRVGAVARAPGEADDFALDDLLPDAEPDREGGKMGVKGSFAVPVLEDDAVPVAGAVPSAKHDGASAGREDLRVQWAGVVDAGVESAGVSVSVSLANGIVSREWLSVFHSYLKKRRRGGSVREFIGPIRAVSRLIACPPTVRPPLCFACCHE